MTEFRIFINADSLVLPLVCPARSLTNRLRRILAYDIVAARADVWDGLTVILQIAALVRPSEQADKPVEAIAPSTDA